jgi:hypothetical protein
MSATLPGFQDPDQLFARNYNRASFTFAHDLAGHPLFELPSLIALAQRLPKEAESYWSNGKVAVNNRWDVGTDGRASLRDTIANIADNNSIVILKHTEQDPVYAPVLQNFLAQIVRASGERMRDDVTIGEALILLSSPNRITPYHFDSEINWLVQVTGHKTFYVFPHDDRSLVSNDELERYFVADQSSAVYKHERQADAIAYDLPAGRGVHIPVTAPHWVQNRDEVSVAISFNFELRSTDRLAKIHRLNHRLRRFGIQPTPPGVSAWRDSLKAMTAMQLASLRALTKPGSRTPAYPTWTPPRS